MKFGTNLPPDEYKGSQKSGLGNSSYRLLLLYLLVNKNFVVVNKLIEAIDDFTVLFY